MRWIEILLPYLVQCCSNSKQISELEDRIQILSEENADFKRQLDQLTLRLSPIEDKVSCSSDLDICTCPVDKVVAPAHYADNCVDQSLACSASTWDDWRLPLSTGGEPLVKPSNYVVSLDVGGLRTEDMIGGRFVYYGCSVIQAQVTEDTCQLLVHANFETVTPDNVYLNVNGHKTSIFVDHNVEKHYIRITPDFPIKSGSTVHIDIRFKVTVPTGNDGMYLSFYDDRLTGDRNYLLTTQFQPTGARMAFPCLDEPGLKATFDFEISFKHYNEYTAIFNTAVASANTVGDVTTNRYERTMIVSPYLLAIIVSPFYVENKAVSDGGVNVRILGRPEFKDQAEFALYETTAVIDNFSELFSFDYCNAFETHCKSDQAGIPQFRSGAMENWGLITYREYYIFLDEQRDSLMLQRDITITIGHELIHQWFGNLVTCDWWDEIYLNEAFGSLGGYLGLTLGNVTTGAEYQWEDEYLSSQTYVGLNVDAKNNTRPMVNNMNNDVSNANYPVDSPAAIGSQFDRVAYNKGGAVMLMVRALIGHDLWVKGLQEYLVKMQYSNSKWFYLLESWDSVVEAAELGTEGLLNLDGLTVTDIFEPYFRQMGSPVVIITFTENGIEVKTDRFLSEIVEDKSFPFSTYSYKWHIPLVVETESGERRILWLKDAGLTDQTYTFDLEPTTVINPNANIWCRINFASSYIEQMPIRNGLAASNIAKVMQDHYQMLTSDYAENYDVDIKTLFTLTKSFIGDDDHTRWIMWQELAVNNIFDKLDAVLLPYLVSNNDEAVRDVYGKYMTSLSLAMFNKVYPDKSNIIGYNIKQARITPFITRLMLRYSEDPEVLRPFWETAALTADGTLAFLQQSPDTRPDTFAGAVIYESLMGPGSNVVTDYLIKDINDQIKGGVEISYVKKCTSQDAASGVNVPLYSGNCIENTYFLALARANDQNLRIKILNAIHPELRNEMIIQFTANPGVKDKESLEELVGADTQFTAEEYTRLIDTACVGMSTLKHKELLQTLHTNTLEWSDVNEDEIGIALERCEQNMIENQEMLDEYLTPVTEYLCDGADGCVPLGKCPAPTSFSYNNWRLPSSYAPEHYTVDLDLDGLKEEDKTDGSFYYRGASSALLTASTDLCHVTIHVNEVSLFSVDSGSLYVDDQLVPTAQRRNDEYNYYHFLPEQPIKAGSKIRVDTTFTVNLMENPTRGLYLSSYPDRTSSEKKYMLATHLESVGARRVFPCFDEPGWKTTFDFSINFKYPDEYTAIFNTQPSSSQNVGDFRKNVYYTTVAMPTYLLAIVVSPFTVELKGTSPRDVQVRILGRPDYDKQASFALSEAMSIVDGFSDYFGIDYCTAYTHSSAGDATICKSDQAGIPTFSPGAMENWGLVLYREYYLFSDDKRDSNLIKRYITRILGHELLHQWFGNYVTCPWWDELYINEAFGSIGGYLGMSVSKSNEFMEYPWEDEYLATQGFIGLSNDGKNSSRPMVNNRNNGGVKVETPSEIGNQFDRIAYNKAGSVMMMIRAVIGDENWRQGLNKYLTARAYQSAGYAELLAGWDGVELPNNAMSVREAFESYFLQMGYPILLVNLNIETKVLSVKTQRYLDSNDDPLTPESEFGYKWNVPFIISINGQEIIYWLEGAGGSGDGASFDISLSDYDLGDLIVNPNANIWARIHFNTEYFTHLNSISWKQNDDFTYSSGIKAGNIGRMMNDYYEFVMGSNALFDGVGFDSILELSTHIRGNADGQFDLSHDRFIVWMELEASFSRFHNLLLIASFEGVEYKNYFSNMLDGYLESYYPDKDPTVEGSYREKFARTSPYIARLALALQENKFLIDSLDLITCVLPGSGFMEEMTFDHKFYEFSPDTREMTFQAAMLADSARVSDVLLTAISEEVASNVGLLPKPLDGMDTFTCTSSYALYDDCLTQKYIEILTYVKTYQEAMDILTKLNEISTQLTSQYLQQLAKRSWLREDLLSEAQENNFVFVDGIALDGTDAALFALESCTHAWTLRDEEQAVNWSNVEVIVAEVGKPDIRWNGGDVSAFCQSQVESNRGYLAEYYPSLRSWLCKNEINCSMPLLELQI